MQNYSNRVWLNPHGHSSTGSVVAFHGEASWINSDGKPSVITVLEIADCHGKMRLHKTDNDTTEQFIEKMEALRNVIDEFIAHLRSA